LQIADVCKQGIIDANGPALLVEYISNCYAASWSGERITAGAINTAFPATKTTLETSSMLPSTLQSQNNCGLWGVQGALRLLEHLTAGDGPLAIAVAGQGLLEALLQLLQAPAASSSVAAAAAQQGVLRLLARLCTVGGVTCQDLLRKAEGVAVLLKECDR
jgi:phage tail tape-measure protein